MPGVRSHEELICWQLAYELKVNVYALIETGSILRDHDLRDQLQRSAGAAPRLIAEGFGKYLPGHFKKYLQDANGELKETYESLRDGVDRKHFTQDQIVPLQRLCKRASKATTNFIAYLRTAAAPHEPRRRPRGTS